MLNEQYEHFHSHLLAQAYNHHFRHFEKFHFVQNTEITINTHNRIKNKTYFKKTQSFKLEKIEMSLKHFALQNLKVVRQYNSYINIYKYIVKHKIQPYKKSIIQNYLLYKK